MEEAVLAFEYGYATLTNGLGYFEAQFGDFANGAQVVIDQFITSGEYKGSFVWINHVVASRLRGQGPNTHLHDSNVTFSCRLKKIQVCVPSTPAQVFHMLRRQAVRLVQATVVMSPKSLLRHKSAVSR